MITVPLVTMNQNSRSLGTFIENFKDTIHFQSYNDKILDDSVDKVVVFFEYLGDNDYVFKTFVNYFETYTKPTFLVIDDSYEGLADVEFLKILKQAIEKYNISDWVILSCNKRLPIMIKRVFGERKYYNNYVYFNVQLSLDRYDGIDLRNQPEDWNGNSNLRQKKYLCLNRQERLHRLQTIDYLAKEDLLKHGFVSCPLGQYKDVLDGTFSNETNLKYRDQNLQNAKLSQPQIKRLKYNLPLQLDLDEQTYSKMARNLPNVDYYFSESYYSIITEGDFYQSEMRKAITEKVFKCFLYKHPFIVIGLPNSLELVRELGFMTFSEMIDESYDEIEDDEQRLYTALEQIKILSNQNIHEVKNLYDGMQEVLQHNRQHYLQLHKQKQPIILLQKIKQWVLYQGEQE